MFPPFFSVLHANGGTVCSFSPDRVLQYPFQFIITSVIPLFDFMSVNSSLPLWVYCFFSMAHQPLVGQGLLLVKDSRSH